MPIEIGRLRLLPIAVLVFLLIRDIADLIEQPMHRLGLHSYSWVIATVLFTLVVGLALVSFARRRSRTS